jgi:hypothetical protein
MDVHAVDFLILVSGSIKTTIAIAWPQSADSPLFYIDNLSMLAPAAAPLERRHTASKALPWTLETENS